MFVLGRQYMELVRQLEGYGRVTFPHCECDSRKNGHVIASVGYDAFRLQVCKEDGTTEVLALQFIVLNDLT